MNLIRHLALSLAGLWMAAVAEGAPKVVVEAGGWDRTATVVQARFPASGASGWELVGTDGVRVPVQEDALGKSWFVVRDLQKGSKRTYTLEAARSRPVEVVRSIRTGDAVRLEAGGRTVLTYRTTPTEFPPGRPDLTPVFRRGGYIHPVLTPSGRQVTDDYPSNHRHHHGIWFAWSSAVFEGRKTDTWNMGDAKGTVEFVGLDEVWNGPVHAGFTSRHRQVDLTSGEARVMLEETWRVRLFAVGSGEARPMFVFDVEVTDQCAGPGTVELPKYRYGGMGVRGNWAWNGTDAMHFLNSEGVTDRSKGDNAETRGRWAYLGGALEDGWAGMAVLDHPSNVSFPQPQRIHPGEPFLSLAPQQAAGLVIRPGNPLQLRYRFVSLDGRPDGVELERLWRDHAEPPVVRVEP